MASNVYTHFLPVVFFFALMHFDITFIPNGTRQTHCVFTSIQRFFPFSHRKPFFHSFCMLQIICKLVLFIYPECHTNHEFKSREIFMLSVCVLVCVCTIHRYDYYCLHYFMRTHLALSIENERCAQPHIYLGCFPLPPISSVVVVVWLAVYCLHFSDFSCYIFVRVVTKFWFLYISLVQILSCASYEQK